jgi:hypothetical protein
MTFKWPLVKTISAFVFSVTHRREALTKELMYKTMLHIHCCTWLWVLLEKLEVNAINCGLQMMENPILNQSYTCQVHWRTEKGTRQGQARHTGKINILLQFKFSIICENYTWHLVFNLKWAHISSSDAGLNTIPDLKFGQQYRYD